MKTTARFTVVHGPLYTDKYEVMQRFARLIPADTVQQDRQCWTDLIVLLDVTFEIGTDPPWPRPTSQISTSFTLQLRDIAYRKSDALRSFIGHIRRDLFEKIDEFVRKEIEQAAPPMPPEPEPVYIPTGITYRGRTIAFESTGDDQIDGFFIEQFTTFLYRKC